MPSFSYRTVVEKLRKLGFSFFRNAKGSHEFWKNETTGKIVLLAKHTKNFPTGTMKKITKDLGFADLKDFEKF
ncbi:MAG: type II toxin-antitoxin system HicA family toxin [Candidatus Peregrinibacteria bacterium]